MECATPKATAPAEMQKFKRVLEQPENPFASLVSNKTIAIIPSFTLESNVTLFNVPLSYSTRGKLSPKGDNVMVICHALSGSPDVGDWWGPLLEGPGRALDMKKFFIICMNSLGSPYGSASPVTWKDGDPTRGIYGPEFPLTTIRDDVRFHKILLDELGVKQVAAVIGGSMGGMLVLEWAYFGKDYVRCIVPIATSSCHSAWGISWGEAQRQSIYADPKYNDGYYSFADAPVAGLGAARMSALLTYRSRHSFDARFGRKTQDTTNKPIITISDKLPSSSLKDVHLATHNDGDLSKRHPNTNSPFEKISNEDVDECTKPNGFHSCNSIDLTHNTNLKSENQESISKFFSAQSYLRYKGSQFVKRFDSNCYISITRKLDTHDLARSRTSSMSEALALIEQPTLVLGVESDGLFTFEEQMELACGIPNSRLEKIVSLEGHDAFLLQFEQVNAHIFKFLKEIIPDIMISGDENDVDRTEMSSVTSEKLSLETVVDDITAW
ncbi:Homoserine O-acetyltransferase [Golovinomyces cichoracearum]|uniref:Homoserine O-acetyltransferase n=1 Tax=Golovinomyces cichoracearum TaxID=62708 RepID=A0A420J3B0_9PEZI|nr:Homoserine O-acetyltransferase [Golovinomyces cichoracearum]